MSQPGAPAADRLSTGPQRTGPYCGSLPGVDVAQILARQGGPHQGLVTAAVRREAGVLGPALTPAVRRGDLVRVRRGVYAGEPLPALPRFVVTDAGVAPTYLVHVRAVLLSLGGTAVATHRTAAALRGWGLLVEPTRIPDVGVPHGRSRAVRDGVRVLQRRHSDSELLTVLPHTAPLLVSTSVRTVIDCAPALPLVEAVVVCDSALRVGAVSVGELRAAGGRLQGVRQAARARRVLAHCDPASGSVLESVLRIRMTLHGLGGFVTQRVIRDAAGWAVVRVDLCFEAARLIVEADGSRWHQDGTDRSRDNLLAALGWRVLRFTWAEIVHEPQHVLGEIRAALHWRQAA